MKVLIVHERYRLPGGEDTVFAAEQRLLSRAGHEVITYQEDNRKLEGINPLRLGAKTIWNHQAAAELRKIVRRERPQIAHFHNTFPLLSPAVYRAVRREGTAVVQTLHNYRLLCLNSMFMRDGRVCQECLGVLPWRGVVHRCYRSDVLASGTVAAMLVAHRALGTWSKQVDAFIALTEFSRGVFERGGLPREKIYVKPNSLPEDPMPGAGDGNFLLFVGRLSEEKGVAVLLHCWDAMGSSAPFLKIAGTGPLAGRVRESAARNDRITYLGECSQERIRSLMRQAIALLLPSLWFEGLPMVVVEAFGTGLPVIASCIGSLPELVADGETGWLLPPADLTAWRRAVDQATQAGRQQLETMRKAARDEYERHFTAGPNLEQLLDVYAQARARITS